MKKCEFCPAKTGHFSHLNFGTCGDAVSKGIKLMILSEVDFGVCQPVFEENLDQETGHEPA